MSLKEKILPVVIMLCAIYVFYIGVKYQPKNLWFAALFILCAVLFLLSVTRFIPDIAILEEGGTENGKDGIRKD